MDLGTSWAFVHTETSTHVCQTTTMRDAVCLLPTLIFVVVTIVLTGLWGHFNPEPTTRTNVRHFLSVSAFVLVSP